MTQDTESRSNIVAAFIGNCNDELLRQTTRSHGWPKRLKLPLPRNDVEQEALELWIAEFEKQAGTRITVEGRKRPAAKRHAAPATTKTQQIGVVSVDAGLCWIGDPCHILHQDALPRSLGNGWLDFVQQLGGGIPTLKQFNHDVGRPGLGVVVSTGAGDGVYPVYAEIVHGRVAKVWIDFLNDAT